MTETGRRETGDSQRVAYKLQGCWLEGGGGSTLPQVIRDIHQFDVNVLGMSALYHLSNTDPASVRPDYIWTLS